MAFRAALWALVAITGLATAGVIPPASVSSADLLASASPVSTTSSVATTAASSAVATPRAFLRRDYFSDLFHLLHESGKHVFNPENEDKEKTPVHRVKEAIKHMYKPEPTDGVPTTRSPGGPNSRRDKMSPTPQHGWIDPNAVWNMDDCLHHCVGFDGYPDEAKWTGMPENVGASDDMKAYLCEQKCHQSERLAKCMYEDNCPDSNATPTTTPITFRGVFKGMTSVTESSHIPHPTGDEWTDDDGKIRHTKREDLVDLPEETQTIKLPSELPNHQPDINREEMRLFHEPPTLNRPLTSLRTSPNSTASPSPTATPCRHRIPFDELGPPMCADDKPEPRAVNACDILGDRENPPPGCNMEHRRSGEVAALRETSMTLPTTAPADLGRSDEFENHSDHERRDDVSGEPDDTTAALSQPSHSWGTSLPPVGGNGGEVTFDPDRLHPFHCPWGVACARVPERPRTSDDGDSHPDVDRRDGDASSAPATSVALAQTTATTPTTMPAGLEPVGRPATGPPVCRYGTLDPECAVADPLDRPHPTHVDPFDDLECTAPWPPCGRWVKGYWIR